MLIKILLKDDLLKKKLTAKFKLILDKLYSKQMRSNGQLKQPFKLFWTRLKNL